MLWLQSFLCWVLWLLRRTLPRRALKQPKGKWTCQLCELGLADDETLYRFDDMTLCKSCHAEAEYMCGSSDDECLHSYKNVLPPTAKGPLVPYSILFRRQAGTDPDGASSARRLVSVRDVSQSILLPLGA